VRRKNKIIIVVLIVFFSLIIGSFIYLNSGGYKAFKNTNLAFIDNEKVGFSSESNTYIWTPIEKTNKGFIFYPGGKVDEKAYAPVLKDIAEEGIKVIMISMPFDLAVFNINAADSVISKEEKIDWYIGGHSLGGAMAANYANRNENKIKGLILWASYPAKSDSLVDFKKDVLLLYGDKDMGVDGIEKNISLLPSKAKIDMKSGANHAQFGYYGPQKGDGVAEIDLVEQQKWILETTVNFIKEK